MSKWMGMILRTSNGQVFFKRRVKIGKNHRTSTTRMSKIKKM
jgi:hypothetical protein